MNKIAHRFAYGMLIAGGAIATVAGSIKPGDNAETVIRELGSPQGRITSGIYEVYSYDRGKVELKSGIVTSVDLISAEEAAARRAAQEKRRLEAEQLARETRERRRIEGNNVLAERVTNTFFLAQSAGDQLTYWDSFRKQYPETDIGAIYTPLSRQYQTEMEHARMRQQLADLQERTAAAEARAVRAERAAEEANQDRQTVTYVGVPWVPNYYPNNYPPPQHDYPHFQQTNTAPRPHPDRPYAPYTPEPRHAMTINTFKPGSTNNSTSVKPEVIFK